MLISVASGKGGTGKTLISTSLAAVLAEEGADVTYADADVCSPNGHIFLRPDIDERGPFTVKAPVWNEDRCRGCGDCARICAFNALLVGNGRALIFDELCHGCGACVEACPAKAMGERDRPIGVIERGTSGRIEFVRGLLDVGEPRATPLIKGVIDRVADLPAKSRVLVDAPPGTSCSAVASVTRADLILLVTEPTPFGLHDLRLSVEMGRALGRRMAAVINRSDAGDDRVASFLEEAQIPVLAHIPHRRAVAEAYCGGRMAVDEIPELKEEMTALARGLEEMLFGGAS